MERIISKHIEQKQYIWYGHVKWKEGNNLKKYRIYEK